MLDRAAAQRAGRDVVVRVGRADGGTATGQVALSVDYSGFRDAYGADWFRRLTLVSLPACALSTPDAAGCRATPLATTNDTARQTLTATVPVAAQSLSVAQAQSAASLSAAAAQGSLVALQSEASSDGGDYKATDLKTSSSWSAGGSTGDFSWVYDVRTPPSPAGDPPSVTIDYSSQAVDGMTAAANSQPSWVGEGFTLQPGSIERSYRSCNDDGQSGVGDLCWAGDNATLSLNGHASALVYDAGANLWRPVTEDGSKIERTTDGSLNNGDNDGEYWKVTTTDGTQYFFGRNRLPGWQSGSPETKSVFTEPVFGNNAGEPCNSPSGGFAASSCQQAYRWNLDYSVDPHGNTISYFYAQETNKYARNKTDASVSTYTSAGYVKEIDYGTRQVAGVDSVFAGTAPARVRFDVTDRCITPGSTCTPTKANAANWPDVPVDYLCTGTTCPGQYSPTFAATKKLSTITTEVASGTKTWRRVEQWRLNQEFKNPGDGNQKILWLKGIDHCGTDDSTCTPATTFAPTQLSNRVDMAGTTNSIVRYRMNTITNESGGALSITYSAPDCVAGSRMPAGPDSNTLRCYPQYWTPPGAQNPKLEYFHKYVVTAVAEADLVGGNADQVTAYTYLGNPAWHYDDASPTTLTSRRTWDGWRGYQQLRTVKGVSTGTQSKSETMYFRGMDGDKTATGTRTATVPDSDGGTVPDANWFAGQEREKVVYLGNTGTVVSKTLTTPYASATTATQGINDIALAARVTGTLSTQEKTALDNGRGWRTTRSTNTYAADRSGRVTQVDDEGDVSTAADDRCTRTTYAGNADGTLIALPARTETVAVRCSATPDRSKDVISDVRTWYDGAQSWSTTLSTGNVTKVDELSDYNGGNPKYVQISAATYDAAGRPKDQFDALNRKTSLAYTPADGPVTRTVTTNPKGWTTTTDLDPGWGLATSTADVNLNRTDLQYDGLGRLTAVWLPGRNKATQTPDVKYAYTLRVSGGPNVVTSSQINRQGTGYITGYVLYDGWLRKRQTQTPGVGGGRIITDQLTDSRGLTVKTRAAYPNPIAPAGTLFMPSGDAAIPSQTVAVYDGAGRKTADILQVQAAEKWRTTTRYGGDHVDVSPPAGGSATTTWSDARGQSTALWTYRGNVADPVNGTHDVATRTYTPAGHLATATDAAGNVWKNTYDQLGRAIEQNDPDLGKTTHTYDDAGRMLTTKDARDITITYAYDELDRRTGEFQGTTQLAKWAYDGLAKGHLDATSRFAGGAEYIDAVTGYTGRYQPTGTKTTVPPAAGAALAGEYTTSTSYNADGSVNTVSLPAKTGTANFGGLSDETLAVGYNDSGLPATLTGLNTYVTDTQYLQTGELGSMNTTNGNGKNILQYWDYEPGTMRLARHQVLGDFGANIVASDTRYGYDAAGNVQSIADRTSQYGGAPDDTQCFGYDTRGQLADAWTPANGSCATAPSVAGLGGPSPYWTSWSHDAAGNRSTEVQHTSAGNLTRSLGYAASGPNAVRPHAATSVTTTGTSSGTNSYTYDNAGKMTSRKRSGRPDQTIGYDAEGRMASVSDTGGTTSYLYTADGDRLLTKEPAATTLYIGNVEYRATSGGTVGTRQYTEGGRTVASRTGAALSWHVTDEQGSAALVFDAATLARTQRRTDPYGNARGGDPAWPLARGFVGGIKDASGLTHLGAREYDPETGRFTSVDPVLDIDSPQQMNGYTYANGNPTSASDPDGTNPCARGESPAECQWDKTMPPPSSPADPYEDAEDYFFSGKNTPKGGKFKLIKTSHTAPGHGIVVMRFFIADDKFYLFGEGDGRGFSTDVGAGYRVVVAWNTDTGEVAVMVSPSCAAGACIPHGDPTKDNEVSAHNSIDIQPSDSGSLKYNVKASSSTNMFPSVDLSMEVKFDDKGNSVVHIEGDPYPSMETIQYNHQGAPKFLAQSPQITGSGPLIDLLASAPRRNETYTNNEGFGSNDTSDQLTTLKHEFCREVRTSPMCLQHK
ncbi:RHS repeat-associated core domain-containing protein [Dactylosporangium salmoneum]|uniref:RHS repeat-associated core domain-containing protein n=1 Tax=Dactylosporangium salmoneum TaxID=53361 RepID=UPI0031D8AF25